MFGYFGSKTRIVHHYPAPAQGRVIEPFAGAAAYALRHWDRDVWINDIDPMIVRIWQYLQQASPEDIRSLPELSTGEDLRDFKQLSAVERELLGFSCGYGRSAPGFTRSPYTIKKHKFALLKKRILLNLPRIKHWKITCLHYTDLPNRKATWFVDPPYQFAKAKYRYNCVLDYDALGQWCQTRKGQVIVCESAGADWLPFSHLAYQRGQRGGYCHEVVWVNS